MKNTIRILVIVGSLAAAALALTFGRSSTPTAAVEKPAAAEHSACGCSHDHAAEKK